MDYHIRKQSRFNRDSAKKSKLKQQTLLGKNDKPQKAQVSSRGVQEKRDWLQYELKATKSKKLSHTFIKPKLFRKLSFATVAIVTVFAGFFVFKLWSTSCKVIECSASTTALALQEEADPTHLRGEGDGRVNILLIGIGGEKHQAGDLSDSLALISVDPIENEAAIISIPRDLYLEIPDHGYARINAAHAYGEQENLPGGGPALLKKTISQAFDIPIHYYVRADFEGFKKAINIVGGVDVNVEKSIYDMSYPGERGGYSPFTLSAGMVHMDGDLALKYSRSRYTTSDFDRSKRQQKILLALKDKALGLGTLTNPLKVGSLLDSVGENVKTDLNINEIIKLVGIARDVSDKRVVNVGIDNSPESFLASANINGASVLVPRGGDFLEIQLFIRNILVDGFIKSENTPIIVLNGHNKSNTDKTVVELKSYGYNVVKVADATNTNYSTSVILDGTAGKKPYTLRYLEERFNIKNSASELMEVGSITVIVGADYNSR